MGQKMDPHGLRVGIIKDWDSKWYANKDYSDKLLKDINNFQGALSSRYLFAFSAIFINDDI